MALVLILWWQANVVIDRRGGACLTEYGLAPINSDPSFTIAATPGAVGTSRWLAPEIITSARTGGSTPVTESKAADVFAFGMFALEVFTGKIPFGELKNEAVVYRVSRGVRPEMPRNAQAVGLTDDVWTLLESCWQQDPQKRPSMEEVVRRWRVFVENGVGKCVHITLAIAPSYSAPSSTLMVGLDLDNRRGPSPSNLRRK